MEKLKFFFDILRDFYKGNTVRLVVAVVVAALVVVNATNGFKGTMSDFGAGVGWIWLGVLYFLNELTLASGAKIREMFAALQAGTEVLVKENEKLREQLKEQAEDEGV